MIKGIPLSVLLAVIILTFYVIDFHFLLQHDRDRKQPGKGWAWDYTLATIVVGLIVLLQPIFLPGIGWSNDSTPGKWLQALGGVSVLLSFALHIWARRHLRYFYTERVEVQSDHRIIDTGPYSLVRHPIIVSFFLIAGGIFLINPALTTSAAFIYTIVDFAKAARQEETLLMKTVPGYDGYMQVTPRFFPRRLWRGR